jgi:ABC-type long-subunit fatty acid transport system fused permease/ATPase subunit
MTFVESEGGWDVRVKMSIMLEENTTTSFVLSEVCLCSVGSLCEYFMAIWRNLKLVEGASVRVR